MGLRKFKFAGTSSSAYNLFITEAATYNVPERAVEMLEIPGRNGHYALDQGRFENVEVTYHVVVHATNNSGFQTEFSDVRNWLASQVGYQRLEDDYNSGVYRMAIFKGGLETSEAFVNGAEFDIVFECKPQRWLTSGETATAVANNGTLSNPTLFDSEPLLAVKGYGTIGFNGYEIEINNETMGTVLLKNAAATFQTLPTITINTDQLNTSDTFTVDADFRISHGKTQYARVESISLGTATNCTGGTSSGTIVYAYMNTATFTKGTSSTATCSIAYSAVTSNAGTVSCTQTYSVAYDGDSTLTFSASGTQLTNIKNTRMCRWDAIYGESSVSILGNPTYIDCDIGECYMIKNSEIISLNQYIDLGSDLPKLSSGTNTFTYDNTVTELNVTPRWWKV